MERFVYRPKYAKLLVDMIDNVTHVEDLAKKHDINAGHLRNVIDKWVREDIVKKVRKGKKYDLSLTRKGVLAAEKFAELMHILNAKKLPEEKPTTSADKKAENKSHKCTCVTRPIEEAEKADYPEGTDVIVDEMCANCKKALKEHEDKNKTGENK